MILIWDTTYGCQMHQKFRNRGQCSMLQHWHTSVIAFTRLNFWLFVHDENSNFGICAFGIHYFKNFLRMITYQHNKDWLSLLDKCEPFGESHGQVGILSRCFYPNDFSANKWSVNNNVECGCIFIVLNIIPSSTEFKCLP
ncbi:hypothetical protein EZV62_003564 [Acer yangbiense]|uniref:Uncharacterized protein n=1 Tax=Acer yangbiense TaxID=1000413 RepID=A0A5C7IHS8_9ROSI|nr:hypothetical protein EZV62_003564 [Acer yangbiense]